METGTLIKYRASAGSGKTTELAFRFLLKLFTKPGPSYRKILAVTFTNKAAAEMKRKILDQLYLISKGQSTPVSQKLTEKTGIPFDKLQSRSGKLLFSLLHDYSFVNIGTIDSFFQRILKAFARETGLHHGYQIEIDHKHILSQAVAETIDDVEGDLILLNWLTRYALDRIEEGKSWNINSDIRKLAEEIFRETFRLLPDEERDKLQNRELLNKFAGNLRKLQKDFASELSQKISVCRSILDEHNVADDMFYGGKRGSIAKFIRKYGGRGFAFYEPPTDTLLKVLDDPPLWTSKGKMTPELKSALDDGFGERFKEVLNYYKENYLVVNSAAFITENIYIIGILADILRNVRNITSAENKFLLSDAGELLHRLIGSDQTPFIYEKAGNLFENFMIDEFQDTSVIQWNNFMPLILESMAGGHDNLVVGDVKQSIYRWRNGDWKIMCGLENQIDRNRIADEKLLTNYRSLRNIVAFNNTLFSVLPQLIDDWSEFQGEGMNLRTLYADARQYCPEGNDGGYIRIEFLKQDDDKQFEDQVLEKIPSLIEELQDRGYKASDIGILVRYNSEGARVINSIIDYRAIIDSEKKKKYNYSIVSGESLFINTSPSVSFIIALFNYLLNPADYLSLAVMIRNYLIATGKCQMAVDLADTSGKIDEIFPQGWREFILSLKQRSVYDAVENIIRFFDLGEYQENCAFLSAFQNSVFEFSVNNSSDIPSFLDWWSVYGPEKSLSLSDYQDSIKVMTIHKAKGLEFKAVIIPFISWPTGHGRDNPVIWIRPGTRPLNETGLVPVRYKKDLRYSTFAEDYYTETFYSYIDNLNLLYVAFTRPREILTGFCPAAGNTASVSNWLKQALSTDTGTASSDDGFPQMNLSDLFNRNEGIFRAGEWPQTEKETPEAETLQEIRTGKYYINDSVKSLRLKFYSENWFALKKEKSIKLNYGKVMHEILASVMTVDDIKDAVEKMIIDGRIGEEEGTVISEGLTEKIKSPPVSVWFSTDARILAEPEILLPGGTVYRPDRVIFYEDRITIVDFKFGAVSKKHSDQVRQYRNLLIEMGYSNINSFLWYVDENKIVEVE